VHYVIFTRAMVETPTILYTFNIMDIYRIHKRYFSSSEQISSLSKAISSRLWLEELRLDFQPFLERPVPTESELSYRYAI